MYIFIKQIHLLYLFIKKMSLQKKLKKTRLNLQVDITFEVKFSAFIRINVSGNSSIDTGLILNYLF